MNTPFDPKNFAPLREALLALHKRLLEYEKHRYESTQGPVKSPNHYFELVTSHRDFFWIKDLSELIVSLDTAMEKPGLDGENCRSLLEYSHRLLNSTPPLNQFGEKYLEAVRSEPEVALIHAETLRLIKQALTS